jgi:prepilin-type N-terminal cleavage/methylation domain-containing protein
MRKKGFTLAEVLITLSIIGVVAALTIPTLTKSFEETRCKAAFKERAPLKTQ